MVGYLIRQTLSFTLTLALVLTMVFFAMRLLPGDPAGLRAGLEASPEQVAAMRHAMGLDQPLVSQFWDYWVRLVQGDLGTSIRERRAVAAILGERLPVTLALAGLALALSLLLGLGLGLLAGLNPGSRVERAVFGYTTLGLTLPEFWLGFLLILLFAVTLRLFPLFGHAEGLLPALHHLFLPAFTLAIPRARHPVAEAAHPLRCAKFQRAARRTGGKHGGDVSHCRGVAKLLGAWRAAADTELGERLAGCPRLSAAPTLGGARAGSGPDPGRLEPAAFVGRAARPS